MWSCSFAPLTQYINNPIFQELTEEDEFTNRERDDRIYTDMWRSKSYTDELEKINRDDSQLALTISLKAAARSNLRYRVTGWAQGEVILFLIKTITSLNQILIKMVRRGRNILKPKRNLHRQRGRGFATNCWRPHKQIGKGGSEYIYQLWGL